MTYLLIMLGVVTGLFATNGGEDFDAFQKKKSAGNTVVIGRDIVVLKDQDTHKIGLKRFRVASGEHCIAVRSQQAVECSGSLKQQGEVVGIKAISFEQGVHPAPGLYRVVYQDGVQCVLTGSKTGLSCNWTLQPSPKLGKVQSILFKEAPDQIPFYWVEYSDQLKCLLPKTKMAIHCWWPEVENGQFRKMVGAN